MITKENNFNLLRLFAAIQVLLFHTVEHLKLNIGLLKYFISYSGVIIFFTISGFLIYLSLERNQGNIRQYILNRCGRIFPGLWTSTIVSFLLLFLSGYFKFKDIFNLKLVLYLVGQLSFFQFWTPGLLRGYGVGTPNGSLWTIPVELQFYFILILIVLYLKKNSYLHFFTILSVFLNIVVYKNFSKDLISIKIFSVTILPYFYNFMIGVYFAKYRFKLMKIIEGKFLIWFVLYNIYVYGFKIFPSYHIDLKVLLSNFLLGILTLSFAFSYRNISNILIKDIDISYGIYLYHMIFLNFLIYFYGMNIKDIPIYAIIIYIITTIIFAIVSEKYVEKPWLKKIKNIGR